MTCVLERFSRQSMTRRGIQKGVSGDMFLIIVVFVGILYFSSCGSGTVQKAGLNYKLMFAAVASTILIFVTAGKREEMTIMFAVLSLGFWVGFAYDMHIKKNQAQDGQHTEHTQEECPSTPIHPYGTEKIFRDAQEVYGKNDRIKWLKREDARFSESAGSTTNIQIVKKYYIIGKNVYISDGGAEKEDGRWE